MRLRHRRTDGAIAVTAVSVGLWMGLAAPDVSPVALSAHRAGLLAGYGALLLVLLVARITLRAR